MAAPSAWDGEPVTSLHKAGFVHHKKESAENVGVWVEYSGKKAYAVWHELDHQWKWQGKFGEELSPVFTDVGSLLTWMRVEGWIA